MTKIAFAVAAAAAEVSEDEDVVEVPIGDKVFLARRPTLGQSVLLSEARDEMSLARVFKLLRVILGDEATEILEQLVWDRRLDFADLIGGGTDLNPNGGLIDQIQEAFAERPTEPSSDSSASRKSTGRRSTGRSPGKGSTHSSSPSTDS